MYVRCVGFQGSALLAMLHADAPSRGDCELLKRLGFMDASEDAKKALDVICLSVEIKLGKTTAANPNR